MPERMDREHEPYSNPLPPAGMESQAESSHHPMTNEDFRKLLMTPRPPAHVPAPAATVEEVHSHPAPKEDESDDDMDDATDDRAEKRKKKKKFYATLNRQQEDKLAELAKKYRDRAKERRDGANPDYQNDDPITSAAGYRAVAPDAKSGLDAAERRRQMIQESKFLGGDMEHTHLVKGLDYALLQKVRSEISSKEKEDEEMEKILFKHKDKEGVEEEIQFKTTLGKNIYRTVFRHHVSEKSELFLPNRMAYIIDLEDEYAESDIPTTLLRSKADCPSFESQTTLTTNDIVINKLTQILSYLRQGLHNKKGKRREKGKGKEDDRNRPKLGDDGIFPEVGDYIPSLERKAREKSKHEKAAAEMERKSYFEKPKLEEEKEKQEEKEKDARNEWRNYLSSNEFGIEVDSNKEQKLAVKGDDSSRLKAKLTSKLERDMPESYAECYPGAPENEDAVADSDDEVDYSKMDMGNKKGPIGRWDFDTQEEYSEYMSNKEALPKAAFQYGVKMADGRKTRRTGTGKRDEKTKLDRELQKINQIIARRKETDSYSSGVGEPEYKRPRY